MKSEVTIRRHIKRAKSLLEKAKLGTKERIATETVITTLRWVVNKKAESDPEGAIIDAMIEDANDSPPSEDDDPPF